MIYFTRYLIQQNIVLPSFFNQEMIDIIQQIMLNSF